MIWTDYAQKSPWKLAQPTAVRIHSKEPNLSDTRGQLHYYLKADFYIIAVNEGPFAAYAIVDCVG